ncbi:MAG: hypothetical protein Fur0025_38990 [Oscillatoriaceae cyanobacterium]
MERYMELKTVPPSPRWAVWVIQAPYPGGYAHREAVVTPELETTWQAWQQMFSLAQLTILGSGFQQAKDKGDQEASPHHPVSPVVLGLKPNYFPGSPNAPASPSGIAVSPLSSQLMLQLGTLLYQWLFEGAIETTLAQSTGIAAGRDQPLRVQLDIRDPDLIAIPWEIMQPRPGKPAISLNPQLRFSRTTTDVEPLSTPHKARGLNILLVLGTGTPTRIDPTLPSPPPVTGGAGDLQLETEAATLSQVLQESSQNPVDAKSIPVSCLVDTLIEPTASQLITYLETGKYNIFFYAGHGVPAPDGGMLLLGADRTLSGTELANVLIAGGVTLALFNSCWGAQPFQPSDAQTSSKYLARSSLAEVLIHHGVPAVLAMRDEIADREALTFIQAFARAIASRVRIDRAVAIARQVLLATYKFNQPAWTLPVLYMHPEFDGSLLEPPELLATELPENSLTRQGFAHGKAFLQPVAESSGALDREAGGTRRPGDQGTSGPVSPSPLLPVSSAPRLLCSPSPLGGWEISGGRFRVGRSSDNDLVLSERWVSQQHAEIFCRDLSASGGGLTYFLRDFSRYGTLIFQDNRWQKVHHQEVPLKSGVLLKFGSSQGQALAFMVKFSIPNDGPEPA